MNQIMLEQNRTYTEDELTDIIRQANPSTSDTHIKWILFDMQKNNRITRVGQRKYISGRGKGYSPDYDSRIANDIVRVVDSSFPLLKIVVWETTILNEWANLLLSKNIVFVEVEAGFESIVFDKLMNSFGIKYTLLLDPDEEMVSRYMRDELIVVKTLFSRSPINRNNRNITLEKLAVDVVADKYLSNILGTSGAEHIVRGIKHDYTINVSKMFTYAKRRNKDKVLKEIWEDKQ